MQRSAQAFYWYPPSSISVVENMPSLEWGSKARKVLSCLWFCMHSSKRSKPNPNHSNRLSRRHHEILRAQKAFTNLVYQKLPPKQVVQGFEVRGRVAGFRVYQRRLGQIAEPGVPRSAWKLCRAREPLMQFVPEPFKGALPEESQTSSRWV